MICERCNTEHPLTDIVNPYYCIARMEERIEALTTNRDTAMSQLEDAEAKNDTMKHESQGMHDNYGKLWDKWEDAEARVERLAAENEVLREQNFAMNASLVNLRPENQRLATILQDWLNFSFDVYTSDCPGMEWLISLKRKTDDALKQPEEGKGNDR